MCLLSVIPASARAYINHRIHPTDDIASVIYHDKAVIGDVNFFPFLLIITFSKIFETTFCELSY